MKENIQKRIRISQKTVIINVSKSRKTIFRILKLIKETCKIHIKLIHKQDTIRTKVLLIILKK